MHLGMANLMAGAAQAAYRENPFDSGEIDFLHHANLFEAGTCRGYVGSNDEGVVVAFQGTYTELNSPANVVKTAFDWLRNFNIGQVEYPDGVCVHAGFDHDIDRVWDDLGSHIVEHGGQEKPVFVTGHSAGAGLATLSGGLLREAGLNIDSVYAFASPRVGNRAYADSYPVPLFRVENKDDLVPHLPLPPVAMKALDFVLEPLAEMLRPVFPSLFPSLAGELEYVHAGSLYFLDWDGELVHSNSIGEFFGRAWQEFWGEGGDYQPGIPVPKPLLDATRALRTAATIGPQIARGTFEFFQNHPMGLHLASLRQFLVAQ